ncbi:MAG: hypothetical protein M3Y29_07115, partial [Chloroflexota bacterium]|nr:hypothetical protein [Chloroflexota bacterium]
PIVSLPFEELLGVVPRRLAPGGTLVVLGARDPQPYLQPLRRLDRSGYAVRFLALGDERDGNRAAAAAVGIGGGTAALDPDWREADALVLAG